MMSQLQNTLKKRQNRTSLQKKLEALAKWSITELIPSFILLFGKKFQALKKSEFVFSILTNILPSKVYNVVAHLKQYF
jgi:hypothetical protein